MTYFTRLARRFVPTLIALALSGCNPTQGADETTSGAENEQEEASAAGVGLLLNADRKPMECADPTVVSAENKGATYYIYCTDMVHVWVTSDWKTFKDARDEVEFRFNGMSENGKETVHWWAPAVIYDPVHDDYVMWVSVLDDQSFPDGARSLAVFEAPSPTGPWLFRRIAMNARSNGEMHIDPMVMHASNGTYMLFYKRYGGDVSSRIMGARLNDSATDIVKGTLTEILHGYGGTGTWEGDCRENPAVWETSNGEFHMLFSGGRWSDNTYGTGHAVSTCGGLCMAEAKGGWHVKSSENRGITQVMQSNKNKNFSHGGPGGAVWIDDTNILYAAAAESANGDGRRYLFKQRLAWSGDAPYLDTAGHEPSSH